MSALDIEEIDRLVGRSVGTYDVPCPICGPGRQSKANQTRRVLRIYREHDGFAGYCCARCGTRGHARDASGPRIYPAKLAKLRAQSDARAAETAKQKREKASAIWSRRRAISSSPAERYLREARGYGGPLPATLGYLPASRLYPHAMIAAFGLATEPEPGAIAIAESAVRAVHLTRLAPDGRGKAGTDRDKIMLGEVRGLPVVLAPPNDQLGLAITEGIEDALSVHEATGLGAWAAGSASFLPALSDAVPPWVECVSVFVDDDAAGREHASTMCSRLRARGIEVVPRLLGGAA